MSSLRRRLRRRDRLHLRTLPKNENACKFRSGKIILQREIPAEQMKKLLPEGRTDLLNRFISKKTGKPFNAFLSLGKRGKVGFEFPPRDD